MRDRMKSVRRSPAGTMCQANRLDARLPGAEAPTQASLDHLDILCCLERTFVGNAARTSDRYAMAVSA